MPQSGEENKKIWQKAHILFHPDTYTGSVEKHTEEEWIFKNNKITKEEITFVPLLYQIFDKVLVDAVAGNKPRDPKVTNIKVTIDVEHNRISVWSNTVDMAVMSANRFLSESFWGSSESSNFFIESVIDTVDMTHHVRYKQVFKGNKRVRHTSVSRVGINSTMVSFTPDLAKFGMDHLENDTVSLMKRRVYDLAGCLGKGVKVELDGTPVLPTTFEDYVKLYPPKLSIFEKVNDRLEVCVGVTDGHFEQVSFVNNTMKGGPHVDYITGQIITFIAKIMNLQPNYIQSHLWVFVNALIDNPAFDSETTEMLTMCKLTPHFFSKLETSDMVTRFWSKADYKQFEQEKTGGKRKWKIDDPELLDAYFAATAYSEDCTLILMQGASADAFASCGVSAVGQVYYGMLPLRCNLPNVKRKKYREKLDRNDEIQNIKGILGLEDGKAYENVKELRYGHLMIMADPDHDGSYFKRLLINFLHSSWPSLLKVPNFILDFIAPVVKASNKETNEVLSFCTMPEYEAWKEKLGNDATKYKLKYYKRLQDCEPEEVAKYFADLDNYTKILFWEDDEDDYAIERAFSEEEEKILENREWLRTHQAGAADIDSKEKHIRYRDFINKELILFSGAEIQRSIASVVDGLKLDQRKILFCASRKALIEKIGVYDLSGYVYAHSPYDDCEASLVGTIISLAQNYVGSNNINLLQPIGIFGTRQMGGKDHGNAKHLDTQLSPITRYMADELLLNYLNDDDGQSIEPAWFIPIIPMVLVNGSEGKGTRWSSFVPNYNPRDIIANLKRLLDGKRMVPMTPWYKGFNGAITEDQMTTARDEGFAEKFKLTTELSTSHMHLFDAKGVLKKYDTPEQILKEFFDLRLEYYEKRRNAKLRELKIAVLLLENKVRFTRQIRDGEVPFGRINEVCAKLEKQGFNKKTEIEGKFDELYELRKNKEETDVEEEVAAGEENPQGNGSITVLRAEYEYLLRTETRFWTDEVKMKELKQEMIAKDEEIDVLTKATAKSLWMGELDALDYQLQLDGNYLRKDENNFQSSQDDCKKLS